MSVSSIPLTKEQENFLKSLEEEFKHRYTEEDKDFQAVVNSEPSEPPVLKEWLNLGRSYNRRRDRYRNNDDYSNRNWSYRDRSESFSRHRNDDRYYDRSQGHQDDYPQRSRNYEGYQQ